MPRDTSTWAEMEALGLHWWRLEPLDALEETEDRKSSEAAREVRLNFASVVFDTIAAHFILRTPPTFYPLGRVDSLVKAFPGVELAWTNPDIDMGKPGRIH